MKTVARRKTAGKAAEQATRAYLAALMKADGIAPESLQMFTAVKGDFPEPGKMPEALPAEYIKTLTKPQNWRKVIAHIGLLTKGGPFEPAVYRAKQRNKMVVILTAENSRKLRELADLVSSDPVHLVNLMVGEELDSYLDPTSGMLETTIDGWKYKNAAEAQRVAEAVNARNESGGYHTSLSCKGRELVHREYRKEKADTRRWSKRYDSHKVA